jgi:Flp pilus assembly protein TadG
MMMARLVATLLRQRSLRFAADQRGVSAVEFALLLPLMLTMYFGTLEVTDAISADRQVTLVASTVANIASQYTQVSSSDVSNILGAAAQVLVPFPVANATVTLTSVQVDLNGNATVDWSATLNGTTRSGNVTSSIPSALVQSSKGGFVLWGEATYHYKPMIGYVVTGTLTMGSQIFARPRMSNCVKYNGTLC